MAGRAFEPLFATANSFVLFNDDASPFALLVTTEVPEHAGGAACPGSGGRRAAAMRSLGWWRWADPVGSAGATRYGLPPPGLKLAFSLPS
jgi:hypothetical protein